MPDEDAIVDRIRAAFPPPAAGLGIGDDTALIPVSGTLAITTDMLVEGVDFLSSIPVEFVMRKSLAANLSDLAAMGAVPQTFLMALGIPPARLEEIDRIIASSAAAARDARITLVGGDLSSAPQLIVSITAIGRVAEGSNAMLRSTARPGDRLYLSRPVGGSSAGLHLLRAGWSIDASGGVAPPPAGNFGYSQRDLAGSAVLRHVAPDAECELGIRLAALEAVHACIDVSDGLSTDLHRLCRASGVGAIVDWERVPPLPDLDRLGPSLGIADWPSCVLHGGEEYALLFTSTLRESELSTRLGRPVFSIGRITESPDVLLESDGRRTLLEAKGFDHFRG